MPRVVPTPSSRIPPLETLPTSRCTPRETMNSSPTTMTMTLLMIGVHIGALKLFLVFRIAPISELIP